MGTCTQQDGKDIHGFETGSRFAITQKNPSPTKLGLPELFMVLKAAKKVPLLNFGGLGLLF